MRPISPALEHVCHADAVNEPPHQAPDRLLLELLIDTVLLGTYDEARWRRLWELRS